MATRSSFFADKKDKATFEARKNSPEGLLDLCFGAGERSGKPPSVGWRRGSESENRYHATFETPYAEFLAKQLKKIIEGEAYQNAIVGTSVGTSFFTQLDPKNANHTTFYITTDNVKNLTDCVSRLLKRGKYQNFPQFYVAKWQPSTGLGT